MLASVLSLETNIIIYLMWSRFSEKVKIVPSECRNAFIEDFNEQRIAGPSLKRRGRGIIIAKENIEAKDEHQEGNERESLWGCQQEGKAAAISTGHILV